MSGGLSVPESQLVPNAETFSFLLSKRLFWVTAHLLFCGTWTRMQCHWHSWRNVREKSKTHRHRYLLLRLLYVVLSQHKIIASTGRQRPKDYHWVLGQSRLQIDIHSQKLKPVLGMVAHAYSLNTWEAEVWGLPWVVGQPELHTEFQVRLVYIARPCIEVEIESEKLPT